MRWKPIKKFADIAADFSPERILFQDELRAGTRTETGRKWSPAGHRPYTPVQIGYESLYLYLALCPLTGQGYAAFLPKLTGEWFSWFVGQINSLVSGRHLLVADGSRAHVVEAFAETQLTFSKLPPYCPELNPVERVFKEVRQGLKARIFSSLAEAEQRLRAVLEALFTGRQRVIELTCFPYILSTSL